MNSVHKIEAQQRPHRETFLSNLRGATLVAMLTVVSALPSYAQSWYAGTSVGSNGTVYGWAVTDVRGYYMYHQATAQATLTSPVKHRQAYASNSAQDTTRADVSLAFDSADLGTYVLSTWHLGFCYMCYCYVLQGGCGDSTTVPRVTLTLRTTCGVWCISPDNNARYEYVRLLGYDALGSFFSQGENPNHIWRTGVEIVGSVFPNFFSDPIILQREILQSRRYIGSTLDPNGTINNEPDTSHYALRDDNPQSNYSGGIVYDLDAPGVGSGSQNPPGTIWRDRTNFRQWATLANGTTVVSGNLYWYARHSIKKESNGDVKLDDVANDNKAGSGTTPLSWNLVQ